MGLEKRVSSGISSVCDIRVPEGEEKSGGSEVECSQDKNEICQLLQHLSCFIVVLHRRFLA